jgi:LysR family transcriptional regulator, benzoate and cis,cis-muconate-responsive activator of ben and cat genes
MEMRHRRYFVAVAEELCFRKGALRLNVSRPALSRQVKDLETEMGVRFFGAGHGDGSGLLLKIG